ncbi:MAG: ABC transporter ATP-binding protein [Gammaproteobacteria bacterium]|nr:ABC transporter ATP-binding protein [Gammaproteobacteria bacterium]
MNSAGPAPVLQVTGLQVSYGPANKSTDAVRGLDFELYPGEVLAVVGESGSGKSQTALALLGLVGAGARRRGSMLLEGQSLDELDETGWTRVRGRRIGLVSQDPGQALNPYLTIGKQMLEMLRWHQGLGGREAKEQAESMLRAVGLTDTPVLLGKYPHELSGGMQQRAVMALALLGKPVVLVADEPTTALDVTTQSQVLALVATLARQSGTAVLLITHDLAVVRGVADRVLVMYGGRVLEQGRTEELFAAAGHPYTAGLMACAPRLDSTPGAALPSLQGQAPGADNWPRGCPFHPRCPRRLERCETGMPALEQISTTHWQACFNPETE